MHPQQKLDELFEAAKTWSCIWGLSRLMRDLTIEFSNDLGPRLGTCDLRTMTITLNGLLLRDGKERLLHETLCHELAHIVASLRYGCRIEEHGAEWSEYMNKAGFHPRPAITLDQVD